MTAMAYMAGATIKKPACCHSCLYFIGMSSSALSDNSSLWVYTLPFSLSVSEYCKFNGVSNGSKTFCDSFILLD